MCRRLQCRKHISTTLSHVEDISSSPDMADVRYGLGGLQVAKAEAGALADNTVLVLKELDELVEDVLL